MSILLQALKKSESQRELGNVPTLQTNTELLTSMGQEPPIWVPTLLVLTAALLIIWLGLEQYRVPEGLLEPSLVQQDSRQEAGQVAQDQASPEIQPNRESSVAAENDPRPQSQTSILPRLTEAVTTDSEQPQREQAPSRLGREVRDYTAEEAAPAGQSVASTPTRDNAIRQSEVARVELDRQQAASSQAQQIPNSAQQPDSTDAYEPEIISYWQVPEKMREGLPEDLRISVLVFAEQPENRFVLLNGERLREGEELTNGLLLEEIRRDGAIFNYRNYRFFLKS